MKKIAALCALTLILLTGISHADAKRNLYCRTERAAVPAIGQERCVLDAKRTEFFQNNSGKDTDTVSYEYDLSVNGKILKIKAIATLLGQNYPLGQILLSYTTPDGIVVEESKRGDQGFTDFSFIFVKIRNQDPGGAYDLYCAIAKGPIVVPDNNFSQLCK